MSRPSSPHDTMREAFVLRLRQLFPNPPTCYREEKEWHIRDGVVRKPDILLKHANNEVWVYEMVHGNHCVDHILESHNHYSKLGIYDYWILWETLKPFTKAKPAPENQRVLAGIGWEKKEYRLTSPQRAILKMQSGETRHLYTFTANFIKGNGAFETALGQLQMVGVMIYTFEGWSGQKKYMGESRYCPITELQFGPDGSPVIPYGGVSEKIIERMMELAGIDPTEERSITEINELMAEVTQSSEWQAKLQLCLIRAAFEQLLPEEQQELTGYFKSKPKVEPVFDGRFKIEDIPNLLNQSGLMHLAGQETQQAMFILEQMPLPRSFMKMLQWMLDSQKLITNSAFLKWQEESHALRASR